MAQSLIQIPAYYRLSFAQLTWNDVSHVNLCYPAFLYHTIKNKWTKLKYSFSGAVSF